VRKLRFRSMVSGTSHERQCVRPACSPLRASCGLAQTFCDPLCWINNVHGHGLNVVASKLPQRLYGGVKCIHQPWVILIGFDEGLERARVVVEMLKEVAMVARHISPHPLQILCGGRIFRMRDPKENIQCGDERALAGRWAGELRGLDQGGVFVEAFEDPLGSIWRGISALEPRSDLMEEGVDGASLSDIQEEFGEVLDYDG